MSLGEFDRSGRRRPVMAGDEYVIEADQVIAAIGQSLNVAQMTNGTALQMTRNGFIQADPVTGQTSVKGIFAGGDAVVGPSSVVEAVAAGEKAAVAIDEYLSGAQHAFWREFRQVDTAFDADADPVEYGRAKMRLLSVTKRRHNFDEVELPFSESVAVREARRCLRCDYREKE